MSRHAVARTLVYTHRWLGIVLSALFIVWFLSGVVMMYARMPALDAVERLARLPAIRPDSIRVPPPGHAGESLSALSLTSLEGRPVYRLTADGRTRFVFADTGDEVPAVDADQAVRIGRAFMGGHVDVRHEARLVDADQWTFGVRRQMPMHRLIADDEAGTRLYVTESSGDVVMKSTASGRTWGALGAVLHWIYFTSLRRHAGLWNEVIVWSSVAGTLLCVAGIAWGLWRLSPIRGYRLRREPQWSPYAGWMRWHHYLGLFFGLTTMMFVFSGLLSMDPWDWHPGTAPTRDQRERLAGGPLTADQLSVPVLQHALRAYMPRLPKEVSLVRFRGHAYMTAVEGVVSLDAPQFGAVDQLPPDLVIGATQLMMPGVPIDGVQWMDEYDAYYYDRKRELSLPVVRVRYADPQHTWLYLDPRHGVIARKEERLTRLNRWLYHGFHSLDFPFLYYQRPLWDIVVIALSAGGLALSVSTITASWHRLRRHAKRVSAGRWSS